MEDEVSVFTETDVSSVSDAQPVIVKATIAAENKTAFVNTFIRLILSSSLSLIFNSLSFESVYALSFILSYV